MKYHLGATRLLLALNRTAPTRQVCRYLVLNVTGAELESVGYKPVLKTGEWHLKGTAGQLITQQRMTWPDTKPTWVEDLDAPISDTTAREVLTILAVAENEESGHILDFHGGQEDIRNKVLRFTCPAWAIHDGRLAGVLAQWAAWLPDFTVDPCALSDIRSGGLFTYGEFNGAAAWKAVYAGLHGNKPSRFWRVLEDAGVLSQWAPTFAKHAMDNPTEWQRALTAVDLAAESKLSVAARLAALSHNMDQGSLTEWRLAPNLYELSREYSLAPEHWGLADSIQKLQVLLTVDWVTLELGVQYRIYEALRNFAPEVIQEFVAVMKILAATRDTHGPLTTLDLIPALIKEVNEVKMPFRAGSSFSEVYRERRMTAIQYFCEKHKPS